MKISVLKTMATVIAIVFMVMPQAPPVSAQSHPESFATVLVSFDRQPGEEQVSLIENLGGAVVRTYHLVPTVVASVPENALSKLSAQAGVTHVERDGSVQAFGQVIPWGVSQIGAPQVYPVNKGTGVKVAVLDTGVDLTHPDLKIAGQITFVAGATSAQDDNGHGTMVAGIIGAQDNDIGVIGVAPEVQLYAVKVLGSNGSGNISDIINGLQWAVDNGMKVVNMSFGGGVWPWAGEQALARAYNAGIVLVAGAGNNGTAAGTEDNINYPARYGMVLAVGAVDEQLGRLSISATGNTLELVAPGNNINTTALGGGYGLFGSTSAATAHVSGAAALVIKSGVTSNLEVRRRLRDTATDLGTPGWDPQYGKGLVNVNRAVNFSPTTDKTAPYTNIVLGGTAGNLGWYRSNVTVTLQPDDGNGSGVAQTRYSLNGGATWNSYTAPFTIQTGGKTDILARSWDKAGNDEGPPNFLTVKVDNTPPVVTLTTSPATIAASGPGTTFSLNIQASAGESPIISGLAASDLRIVDPYGTYSVDYGPVRTIVATLEDWAKTGDTAGRTYSVIATATDVAGNTTTVTSTVTVTPATAGSTPVVTATPTPVTSRAATPTPATPPILTLLATPNTIRGDNQGSAVTVNIYGQVQAVQRGAKIASSNMRIVDDYGVATTDLGPVQPRSIVLKSWTKEGVKKGRNYTISATATDTAGNVATRSITITVEPQAKRPAVDKIPPRVTVEVNRKKISGRASGTMVQVRIVAAAHDVPAKKGLASSSLKLIDEYGVYSKDLGAVRSGTITVEAWARDDDPKGRTYTLVATATDKAGLTSTATATVTVTPGRQPQGPTGPGKSANR